MLAAIYVYVSSNGNGNFSQSGGTNALASFLSVGNNNGGNGAYNLSGSGLLTVPTEYIGGLYGGNGIFTQSGGTNNVSGILAVAQNANCVGTYVLNGGLLLLSASGMTSGLGTPTFDFGGGTLGASAPWSSSVDMDLTGTGGPGTVDTSGGNIRLSGILSGSGGLTKIGAGTLTLSGSNSYSGGTTIVDGTLIVANESAVADGTNLTVGADAASIFNAPTVVANSPVVVPEPGTLVLLGAGAVGLLGWLRRRRSKRAKQTRQEVKPHQYQ